MFNMRGHNIEITGLRALTPPQEQVLKDTGLDISDWGMVRHRLEKDGHLIGNDNKELTWQDISMVVWGEDLARVPLIVYDHIGDVIWYDSSILSGEQFQTLSRAARDINRVQEALVA